MLKCCKECAKCVPESDQIGRMTLTWTRSTSWLKRENRRCWCALKPRHVRSAPSPPPPASYDVLSRMVKNDKELNATTSLSLHDPHTRSSSSSSPPPPDAAQVMPLSPHAYTSTLARATVMLALVVTAAAVGVAALPAWRRGLLPFGTQYPGSNLLAKTYPNEITARYNSSVWVSRQTCMYALQVKANASIVLSDPTCTESSCCSTVACWSEAPLISPSARLGS